MRRKNNSAVCNVECSEELKRIIDEVSRLVASIRSRGYIPTFSVKTGTIGMVAVYKETQTTVIKRKIKTSNVHSVLSEETDVEIGQ